MYKITDKNIPEDAVLVTDPLVIQIMEGMEKLSENQQQVFVEKLIELRDQSTS